MNSLNAHLTLTRRSPSCHDVPRSRTLQLSLIVIFHRISPAKLILSCRIRFKRAVNDDEKLHRNRRLVLGQRQLGDDADLALGYNE